MNSAEDFSQRRGRIDVQGRPFAVVQRDRKQPAVRQRQGVQRAPLRSAAPQPPAQGVVARQPADAEQLQQRPDAASPSLRTGSASAARPLREADLSFVVEILYDWMSIKPCSDRVRPTGEM